MEGDPFALIEALTIAGYATGCERGYIYIRGEYPLAHERLEHAIDAARDARAPRRRRHGRGLRVRHRAAARRRRLHLRRGDGALQLDRGQARRAAQQAAVPGRARPVRQADRRSTTSRRWSTCSRSCAIGGAGLRRDRHAGLDGPAAVLPVRLRRAPGRCTRSSSARRSRELLEMAGGVRGGRPLQAVLLGGAAGTFVGAGRARHAAHVRGHPGGRCDARLGRRHGLRRHGRPAPTSCCASRAFFRDESCGQCVPCRVGTVRQEEALHRLASERHPRLARPGDRPARRDRAGHARRLDLRSGPDRARAPIQSAHRAARRVSGMERPMTPPPRAIRSRRRGAWSS